MDNSKKRFPHLNSGKRIGHQSNESINQYNDRHNMVHGTHAITSCFCQSMFGGVEALYVLIGWTTGVSHDQICIIHLTIPKHVPEQGLKRFSKARNRCTPINF